VNTPAKFEVRLLLISPYSAGWSLRYEYEERRCLANSPCI